jgi:poly(beta-D-mannuronate) lyase
VTLERFKLTGSQGLSIPAGATHIQITRNTFQMAGSVQYWLTVGGDEAQIDHNTFQHKNTIGNFIEVVGPGTSGMAQNTWIHHSYFPRPVLHRCQRWRVDPGRAVRAAAQRGARTLDCED